VAQNEAATATSRSAALARLPAPVVRTDSQVEAWYLESNTKYREMMALRMETPTRLLIDLAAKDFWVVRLAAIHNPAFPSDRREAALATLSDEVRAALEPQPPFAADELSLEDFVAPFAVLGLTPEEDDREAIAKAAKSKDWVQRVAACLCEGITPGELNRLLDDEVDVVRQLAIHKLQTMEAA